MSKTIIERPPFHKSCLMDFCSQKELETQTGHKAAEWPLVAVKELVDNALDICEEKGVQPKITIRVDQEGIRVTDNGPGMRPEVVAGIKDFSNRVSSREAVVSVSRGAQGHALKTLFAMPYTLEGNEGVMEIVTKGERHRLALRVNKVRQEIIPDHQREPDADAAVGTTVLIRWPKSALHILENAKKPILQLMNNYAILNPHLTLSLDFFGLKTSAAATKPVWHKWIPSWPTSPHWYDVESFNRYAAANLTHDQDHDRDRPLRDLLKEFDGLSSTVKRSGLLKALGLGREPLSCLLQNGEINQLLLQRLLEEMQKVTKPVKPKDLGLIGREHFRTRFEQAECEMESFKYATAFGTTAKGLPWCLEAAFAWSPEAVERQLVIGVNWSPSIINPFRQLGRTRESLDSILERQRAGPNEPIMVALHMACPRPGHTDRGKSAVIIED